MTKSNLRKYRVQTGLSLRKFAKKCGWDGATQSRFERGLRRMSADHVLKIIRELDMAGVDVTFEDLFFMEEDEEGSQ